MPRKRASGTRVLILYSTYGGPSRASAEAVAGALRSREGVSVDAVDFFERCMPAMAVLARFAYRQSTEFFLRGAGGLDVVAARGPGSALSQELHSRGLQALAELLRSVGPTAVIATCPIAAGAAAEVCAPGGPPCAHVVMDLSARFLWLHPRIALHFVATREMRDELVVSGVPFDRIIVSGAPVQRREVPEGGGAACRAALGLQDRFTVAVAGLGALGEEGDAFSSLVRASLQVVALVAENPRARERARKAALAAPGQVVCIEELHRYGVATRACDVLACAPGSPRAFEALAAGLPVVLYAPVPERERDNAEFLLDIGAALLARDESAIAEKCRFLATHPERSAQLAVSSAALGRPGAAAAIADRVLAGARC